MPEGSGEWQCIAVVLAALVMNLVVSLAVAAPPHPMRQPNPTVAFALCGSDTDGHALYGADGDRRRPLALNSNQTIGGCDCLRDAAAEKAYKAANGNERAIYKLDTDTGAPTVCAPYDCACNPTCYNCITTYEWLGGVFDAWQLAIFFAVVAAFLYNSHALYFKLQHERASNKRRGFSVVLAVLCANEVALLGRVLWVVDPMMRSAFWPGAHTQSADLSAMRGLFLSTVVQAFLLKLPEILWMACALTLCLVYKASKHIHHQMYAYLRISRLRTGPHMLTRDLVQAI